jgi:hypothetical protein
LGPILFLLYIYDSPTCYVQGIKMVLYADDTNIPIYRDENALKLKIECVMKQLEVSFLNNELILNIQNLCDVFSF